MKPARRSSARALARWHRRLGALAAALVLLLSVTGILLNHSSELALGSRFVRTSWLLDWYGIEAPHAPRGYLVGNRWISQIGARVYFDANDLGDFGPLVGAVALPNAIAVAAGGKIILLTHTGEKIEILGSEHGVPAGMRALGRSGGALAVHAAHGLYRANADLTRWHERGDKNVVWATPGTPPAALQTQLIAAYRGQGLSVERVLRDLHSGRVLGRFGYWLMDLAALALVLLATTGLWLWMRRGK